ncbi:MAG: hypothetical protein CXT72_03505 [Methanobacteriota archaeon]|jgi:hypothetical protein|nr:MAG: hypothetical protein CXT72_03505 [Euryarchaeota archaeon]HIE63616.1 hypothetical protein [Candidatus Poseidoniales archaeon]HIK99386.1 hypothetical protein [Candidatus Poseidoniales archaeon]
MERAQISKINLKKGDKKMTSIEVIKQTFTIVFVISIFDVMFYIMYIQEGTIIPLIACGLPLTLAVIAVLPQFIKHFLGVGQMVITSDNQMILRTSKPIKSHFKPSGSSFTPLTQVAKDDSDNDEDTEVEESSDWWMGKEED